MRKGSRKYTECQVEGCEKTEPFTHGFCDMHYRRWMKYEDPLVLKISSAATPGQVCSIEDCTGVIVALGWCNKHYRRALRNGDPLILLVDTAKGRTCNADGCMASVRCIGLCGRHYDQYLRNGGKDGVLPSLKCRTCENFFIPNEYSMNECSEECKKTYSSWRSGARRYNITIAEYAEVVSQPCEICGKTTTPEKRIGLDHDHGCCPEEPTCGLCNRGPLCWRCNLGISWFDDDDSLLESATFYLRKHAGQ